jgi:hypothetical protein
MNDGRMSRGRRPLMLAIGLAALFGLAELPFASFMADDLIQLGFLEGVSPATWIGPLELYTISDGEPAHMQVMKDAGAFPWFFDPDFKMAFARPLSSALLAADHALFGLHPLGYRVHGALWFVVLVAGLGVLLRRALPGPVGALALLIFTISGIHGVLAWTATRHIVIAGALGLLALGWHVRWREQGWRPGAALAVAGFALSLGASEAAVGVLAYLAAYELLAGPGGWRRRLTALLPVGLLFVAYLVLYRVLDLGASGGSGYLDPLREPLSYAVHLPGRLLFLLGAMVLGGNADLWVLRPDLRPALVVVGAVAAAGLGGLLLATRPAADAPHRRGARWLIAGALLSALPFTGTPIGSRCLVVPLLGGSVAIALVLHGWWTALRARPGITNRLLGAACVLLALLHLGLAPLARLAAPPLLREMMVTRLATAMETLDLDEGQLAAQTVILPAAPDIAIGFHSYFHRSLAGLPMPARWRALSWAPTDHRLHRTADDTFELEMVDGAMEGSHLEAGQILILDGLTATVLELGDIGPSRVRFQLDRSLDDPDVVLLEWRDGGLRRFQPPAAGSFVLLPRAP